jgi:vitamin B12 transporter
LARERAAAHVRLGGQPVQAVGFVQTRANRLDQLGQSMARHGQRQGLGDELRLTASYGTAFKAPTFNQLYFPGFGNPQLDAEQSRSLELGLAGQHSWGHWAVNAYRSEIDNLIATVNTVVGGQTQSRAEGVDLARIRGLELQLGSEWLGWQWTANYSLMSAENRSERSSRTGIAYYGKQLNRRPGQLFNLDMDRAFGAFSVGASVYAQNSTFDDLENQTELSGFATVDLRGEYRLTPEWLTVFDALALIILASLRPLLHTLYTFVVK